MWSGVGVTTGGISDVTASVSWVCVVSVERRWAVVSCGGGSGSGIVTKIRACVCYSSDHRGLGFGRTFVKIEDELWGDNATLERIQILYI